MKAIHILWDVDKDEDTTDVYLPDEVEIPHELEGKDEEEISDYLTDLTGFCRKGFELVDAPNEHCPLGGDEE